MKKYLSELKTAYSTNLGMKLRVVFLNECPLSASESQNIFHVKGTLCLSRLTSLIKV